MAKFLLPFLLVIGTACDNAAETDEVLGGITLELIHPGVREYDISSFIIYSADGKVYKSWVRGDEIPTRIPLAEGNYHIEIESGREIFMEVNLKRSGPVSDPFHIDRIGRIDVIVWAESSDLEVSWDLVEDIDFPQIISGFLFATGDNIYLGIGGSVEDFEGTGREFWKYSIQDGIWTQMADLPQPGAQLEAFTIGDTGYLLKGLFAQQKSEFYKYIPQTDEWIQLPDFPGKFRTEALSFVIDGIAYVGSGNDAFNGYSNDFYSYDPSDESWSPIKGFPGLPFSRGNAFVIDGVGHILGGISNDGFSKEHWLYDPIEDSWSEWQDYAGLATFPNLAIAKNGIGYFGLGNDQDGRISGDFWYYLPNADEWRFLSTFYHGPDPSQAILTGANEDMAFYIYWAGDKQNLRIFSPQ